MAKPIRYVTKFDVRHSHQMAVRARVLAPRDRGGSKEMVAIKTLDETIDGNVSLDAGAEARGRLSMSIPAVDELVPTRPTDLLAPFGNEIQIERGIEYGDHIDLMPLGTFRIENTSVGANTIEIDGLDRTGWYQDALFEYSGQWPAGMQIDEAIFYTVAEAGMDWLRFEYDGRFDLALPGIVTWEEGDNRWAFVQGMARALGAELFFNRYGSLVLQPVPLDTSGADAGVYAEWRPGRQGTLLSIGRDYDRTTIVNSVQVTGENLTGFGIPVGWAYDDNPASPTYFYGPFGHKPLYVQNNFIGTNEQATLMAQGILIRSLGRPDAIEFEAIVNPALEPSQTVWIFREQLNIQEKHVIDQVTIPLSPGEPMRARTRAVQLFDIPG